MARYKTYSEEEIQFIKDNHGKMSDRDLARMLGRGYDAIQTKICKMGISGRRDKFSDSQKEIMLKNYGVISTKDIAEHICVSTRDVYEFIARHRKLNV